MKAQHQLSNLSVDTVSLVSRAAVRDPSNPSEPQRFLLRKSAKKKTKGERKGKRFLEGHGEISEAELIDMHRRATTGRRHNDPGVTKMAKQARRETLRKVERGESVSTEELSGALADATRSAAAKIRKADPTLSDYDSQVMALRKDDEVRRLQAAYSATVNPVAAAIAKGATVASNIPVTGTQAATDLRAAAATIRKADTSVSEYDAMLEALRRNPGLYASR